MLLAARPGSLFKHEPCLAYFGQIEQRQQHSASCLHQNRLHWKNQQSTEAPFWSTAVILGLQLWSWCREPANPGSCPFPPSETDSLRSQPPSLRALIPMERILRALLEQVRCLSNPFVKHNQAPVCTNDCLSRLLSSHQDRGDMQCRFELI